MTAILRVPPAPVGQQGPPARAAASDSWRSLRVARGSLPLTTGTGDRRDMNDGGNILLQDPCAWHVGYRAGLLDLRGNAFPSRAATTDRWSWSSGYIEGKAAQLNGPNASPELDENREH